MTTFFKYIKLNNGENIIVKTLDECNSIADKKYIEILDPVVVVSIKMPRGSYIFETFIMQPWLKPAKEGVIFLPTTSILVMADLDETVIEQYLGFIQELKYNMVERSSQSKHETSETVLSIDDDELDESIETVSDMEEYLNNIMENIAHAGKKTVH